MYLGCIGNPFDTCAALCQAAVKQPLSRNLEAARPELSTHNADIQQGSLKGPVGNYYQRAVADEI